jgi:hypothetical protein
MDLSPDRDAQEVPEPTGEVFRLADWRDLAALAESLDCLTRAGRSVGHASFGDVWQVDGTRPPNYVLDAG